MSDQEISSYMDFEELLVKQKQYTTSSTKNIFKWSLIVAVIGSVSLWWILREETKSQNKSLTTIKTVIEEKSPERPSPVNEKNSIRQQPKDKADRKPISASPTANTQELDREEKIEPIVSVQKEAIYHQAEPVEGYPHLYQYFNAELIYPQVAIKDSVQGVLTIEFIVNLEGKPENIKVIQSLGTAFDEEAIRLIQNMPAWNPAILNGKPVSSKISLPLTFQIQTMKTHE